MRVGQVKMPQSLLFLLRFSHFSWINAHWIAVKSLVNFQSFVKVFKTFTKEFQMWLGNRTMEASNSTGHLIRLLLIQSVFWTKGAESKRRMKNFPTYNQLGELFKFLVAIKCVFKTIALQVMEISSSFCLQA